MKAKKALVLLGVGAILAIGTAASDGGVKIGVVDIDQAISSTEEGKAAREEFARKQRAAQGVVQPLLDRYKALEEEIADLLARDGIVAIEWAHPLTPPIAGAIHVRIDDRGGDARTICIDAGAARNSRVDADRDPR